MRGGIRRLASAHKKSASRGMLERAESKKTRLLPFIGVRRFKPSIAIFKAAAYCLNSCKFGDMLCTTSEAIEEAQKTIAYSHDSDLRSISHSTIFVAFRRSVGSKKTRNFYVAFRFSFNRWQPGFLRASHISSVLRSAAIVKFASTITNEQSSKSACWRSIYKMPALNASLNFDSHRFRRNVCHDLLDRR